MITYLLQGVLLGFGYVAPIGLQNLYVINTSVSGNALRAYFVAITTILFDISLAISCFYGIGYLLETFELLKQIILLIGSIAVVLIGAKLIRSKVESSKKEKNKDSMVKVVAACFAVTWLNPQAIIDGSLLLGGYNASLPVSYRYYFISGFCMSSAVWFLSLSSVTLLVKDKFNERVLSAINVICGGILLIFGLKLGVAFYLTL